VEKIEAYDEAANTSGILYMYSLMARKVFIFDIPELDDTLSDDYVSSLDSSSSSRDVPLIEPSSLVPRVQFNLQGGSNLKKTFDADEEDGVLFSLRKIATDFLCYIGDNSHDACSPRVATQQPSNS